MKTAISILGALLVLNSVVNAEEPFHIYAPSSHNQQL